MVLPRSTSHLLRHLVVLVAVFSTVAVRAELDSDSNGDDAHLKLITVPDPHLPPVLPTFQRRNRRFDVQEEPSSLQERRSTTSQLLQGMLPRLNLQTQKDDMRLKTQTVFQGASKEILPGNNLRDADNPAKIPVQFFIEEHSKKTLNKTFNHIGAVGVHETGESHPKDVSRNSFQVETSSKSCSELTRHSLEVIKNGEQFFDWPSLLQSIESCCQGIGQAYSSHKFLYSSMCGEYHKLNNSKYQGSIDLKKGWREATVRDFTESLVAAVAEAVVAADEGKTASMADGATTAIDKLLEEGTSMPLSRKAVGRLLVLFVPQINGTNSDDSPGERGEDLARLSILKIIKAKILKSFKQFEKWVSSQTNPIKVAES